MLWVSIRQLELQAMLTEQGLSYYSKDQLSCSLSLEILAQYHLSFMTFTSQVS